MQLSKPLETIFENPKPVIGMVHLRPLPGSPLYNQKDLGMKEILKIAIEEAKILEDAGVDGIQVENIWDYPYAKTGKIPLETVASLAVAAHEVRSNVKIPIGVNAHMNGGVEALVSAIASQAQWIRVFEWCNSYISQVGFVDAVGSEVATKRSHLGAHQIISMCDVNVKHGSHFIISDRSIEEQARDIEQQGGDVLIVTGFETGTPPTAEKVELVKKEVTLPVILGSGVNTNNVQSLLRVSDGAIVGSWFKKDNQWKNRVDFERTRTFMKEVELLRSNLK
ncbi:MAG: BtpA/SgcQ family protein [Bacteroidia bacterium]|jgi:membrane complex biogenesis BtpA family protein|nr:BtpA/SgcQ family protein [Bacteroidia bacterium]